MVPIPCQAVFEYFFSVPLAFLRVSGRFVERAKKADKEPQDPLS